MPGTPAHTMFKLKVKRLPGVTNADWRLYIHDAVLNFGRTVARESFDGMQDDDVTVFNFKRRPPLGFLVCCTGATRDNRFPKFFNTRQEADNVADQYRDHGLELRVKPVVEDKRREQP